MCSQQLNSWLWKVILFWKSGKKKKTRAWHRAVVGDDDLLSFAQVICRVRQSGEMNRVCWRAGDEVAWSGEQNGSGWGRQAWTDWSKRGHGYRKSHKEKGTSANHTQKTSKHTHMQLMRMMESRWLTRRSRWDLRRDLQPHPHAQTQSQTWGERKHTESKGVPWNGVCNSFHQGCTFRHRLEVMLGHSGLCFASHYHSCWCAQSPLIQEHSHEIHLDLCCNQIQRLFTYDQIYEK